MTKGAKRVKFFDCITFFRENFITNIRFEILKNSVDYFVVCESKYDHLGNEKNFNFKLSNSSLKNKIIYIKMHEKLPNSLNAWERQAYQRDYMLRNIKKVSKDDYIFFSDPDEIPNPKVLENFNLEKKYGIFLQDHFVYKFNIFNKYDTPWSGTRVCKYKNLKSIDFMRQGVLIKNINKWWRPDKEKNIQVVKNGGWHFNNVFSPREISIKLKTFAHQEFSKEEFSNTAVIKRKIYQLKDLFGRGQKFKIVSLGPTFPEYILRNKSRLSKFIV
jgi:beta-1,4-mannosyl-glycoprotein beta-1,4-N-acetylglucosaminyltransferase